MSNIEIKISSDEIKNLVSSHINRTVFNLGEIKTLNQLEENEYKLTMFSNLYGYEYTAILSILYTNRGMLFFSFINPRNSNTIFRTKFRVDSTETVDIFLTKILPLCSQVADMLTICDTIYKSNELPASFWREMYINDFLEDKHAD